MRVQNLDAILNPEGLMDAQQHELAPRRFKTLDGVRLGLVGNTKLNADAVLLAVGDLLKEQYDIQSVFMRTKPSFAKPVHDELIAEMLENADVIVAGVGD